MHKLILQDENGPVTFNVANGFVSRVVSAVANQNYADAYRVAEILNKLALEEK